MKLPHKINLIEVGPRDGFQLETKIIPTELKLSIINTLADAGIRQIQVTSFVNPKRVLQMADADELIKHLPKKDGVLYTGLVLNAKGVTRAYNSGLSCVELSISASDTHSRKNAGMSHKQALEQGREMTRLAGEYGMQFIASIQCAFGCVYEGEISISNVINAARMFMDSGVIRLSLADTTGMANPISVSKLVNVLHDEIGDIPLGLHLHDTRGLGLANLMAGMECGVTHFDTALGGMGGCPFVRGAAGNIATEDTLYLMESMNINTGIDRQKVAECSRQMEAFLGKTLPGKLYRME